MTAPVTLQIIARRAGLSVAAVSYALRGSPKVASETVVQVRALADQLGYRPNARIAELMTHIRFARSHQRGDVLALVWLEGLPTDTDEFCRAIHEGAAKRAHRRGFKLQSFWIEEAGGSASRLAGILRARGVAGVVFAPVQRSVRVELDWPWPEFPLAVVGMAEWSQPVTRAGHHHFEAMRRALRHVKEMRAHRPACWLNLAADERAHRGWSAAWLAGGLFRGASRLMQAEVAKPEACRDWLKQLRPDALVVSHKSELDVLRSAGWKGAMECTVLLDWRPGARALGVDQGYPEIAASAVDLVIEQLYHNERGLPDPPRMLLFPGHWCRGE